MGIIPNLISLSPHLPIYKVNINLLLNREYQTQLVHKKNSSWYIPDRI